jgi:hypothetical protein
MQPGRRGRDDTVEIAERVEEKPGEGLDVLPGDGAEEDKLQHFVVRQGRAAGLQEPVTQALAVVGDVGGQAAGDGRGHSFVFLANGREEWQGNFTKRLGHPAMIAA